MQLSVLREHKAYNILAIFDQNENGFRSLLSLFLKMTLKNISRYCRLNWADDGYFLYSIC
jgi:hypothetical protein